MSGPEARPVPKQHPKWTPTSCTARGMTCGHVDAAEGGAAGDETRADETPITAEQSGTDEHTKKRDIDNVAQVWSAAGRSFFADDEGNVVQIEERTAFAT